LLYAYQFFSEMKYCESTFIRWHQCSWFQQNVGIPVVEFAVSNTTDNN
jgi:hypothetical protein